MSDAKISALTPSVLSDLAETSSVPMYAVGAADTLQTLIPILRQLLGNAPVKSHGNISGAQNFNHADGEIHTGVITGNITITFQNPPATGKIGVWYGIITQDGTHTTSFADTIDWGSVGAPPVGTNGEVQRWVVFTLNGGTSYIGSLNPKVLPIAAGGTGVSTAPTNGQLLIGKTSDGSLNWATLTAGANVSITNGAGTITIGASGGGGGGTVIPGTCQFRLTLETGVAVSTSDQTGKTTLYATPFNGSHISLYTSSTQTDYASAQMSLALGTLTSGKNYDVFCYDVSGVPTLILGPAWTSDTARGSGAGTTELTTQDGAVVNANSISSGPGAKAGLYLGTIRTTSTTTTEDSKLKRFVYNHYNRRSRELVVLESTASWTYSTGTIRQANGASGNKVEYVSGDADVLVAAEVVATVIPGTTITSGLTAAVGVDSVTAYAAGVIRGAYALGTVRSAIGSRYCGRPGLGYHYLAWLEFGSSGASFEGFQSDTGEQSGLMATVEQ